MSLCCRITTRGGKWGVRALRLALASCDRDCDGLVNEEEVVEAINTFGVRCGRGGRDVTEFLDAVRRDVQANMRGTMLKIDEIMRHVVGPVPRDVLQLICVAYDFVSREYAKSHRGVCLGGAPPLPTIGFLCQVTRLDRHQDVEASLVTLKDALFCYFASWGVAQSATASQPLFIEFHVDLLAGRTRDNALDMLGRLYGVGPNDALLLEKNSSTKQLVPDRKSSDKLFETIDMNNNGALSLAELDLAVIRLWPELNFKPAIMRAYKLADTSRNGTLSKSEFFKFLHYLVEYSRLLAQFREIDKNEDGRITFDELRVSKKALGLGDIGDVELREIFRAMDGNQGGKVLFEEFAVYLARKRGDAALSRITNEFV